MNTEMQPSAVDFHGHQLTTIEHNGGPYVAMKPIAEALGLIWAKQLQLIKRDVVLSEAMTVMVIPSDGGPQTKRENSRQLTLGL